MQIYKQEAEQEKVQRNTENLRNYKKLLGSTLSR
jgi:hypothetical protein